MSKYNPSFIINSKTRLSGSISNFTHLVDINNDYKFDLVACIASNIPKTFYNVQEGKNKFNLIINNTPIEIILPIGNYNENNTPIILKQLLDQASLSYNITFTITMPDKNTQVDTRKWIFECSNTVIPIAFEIITEEDVDELLGFDKGVFDFENGKLQSINVVNYNLSHYLVIRSDICSNQGNSKSDHNILTSIGIPRGIQFGETVNYSIADLKSQSKSLNNKGNKIYNFELLNDRGELVDTNGHDWTLEITLYKYDDSPELVRKDLIAKHLVKLEEKNEKHKDKSVSVINKESK